MTKKQHYMTEHERYKLESYLEAGRGVSWIARKLGFCRQTIYNEIKRGAYLHTVRWWDEVRYSADKGQKIHRYNQTAKGRPLKIGTDRTYADFLERKMLGVQDNGKVDRRKRYSPAAALELARREGFETSVSVGTLYNYIDKRVFLNLSNKDLWEKGKPKKQGYRPVRRVAHPALPSIVDRPQIINQREELGHKEIDLIVGREGSKAAVLTITEKGYGKRTPVEEYRITKRNACGIKNYMLTEKTGLVVGIKVVDGSEDLLLVTEAGILIRTPVEAIKQCGRSTQGVIVMRFKEEGDRVISMALADREEAEEEKEP